jgi:F-type H+-transporting ATPase subunit delta
MTSRAVATRYARALFDVALKEADVAQVGRELSAFAAVVASSDALSRALANPAVPPARKRMVVDALLAAGGAVPPALAKLLGLLADRDRLMLLDEVAAAYEARLLQHANVVRAEVRTAVALSPDRIEALKAGLARATGRTVRLEATVDAGIIGGAVTRVGSTVFDGSVVRQLQKMKETLTA